MLILAAAGGLGATRPYLIVASPRAASTTLCNSIDTQSGLKCEGELLHPMNWKNVSSAYGLRAECTGPRSCIKLTMRSIMHQYWQGCPPTRLGCGFKLFAGHIVDKMYSPDGAGRIRGAVTDVATALRLNGVSSIVILERRNRTAQYASVVRAFETGEWGFDHPGRVNTEFRKSVSQRQFEEALDTWYSNFRALPGLRFLTMYTEDIVEDQKANRSEQLQSVVRFITSRSHAAQSGT